MTRTKLVLLVGGISAIGAVAVLTGAGNEVSEKAISKIDSPSVEGLVTLFEPDASDESDDTSRYPLPPIPTVPHDNQEARDTIESSMAKGPSFAPANSATAEPRYLDDLGGSQASPPDLSNSVSPEQMQVTLDRLTSQKPQSTEKNEQSTGTSEASSSVNPAVPELAPAALEKSSDIPSASLENAIRAIGVRVGEHWRVPPSEIERHGAVVSLTLNAQGEIIEAVVTRSSDHSLYDLSVLNAARDAAPFDEIVALPEGTRDQLTQFNLTFGSLAAIEEHEAQEPLEQQTVEKPQPGQQAKRAAEEKGYLWSVKQQIAKSWTLPEGARLSHEITVVAGLAAPFGTVSRADVLRSSGDPALDEAAVNAVKQAGPFTELRDMSLNDQQALAEFRVRFLPSGEVL